MAMLLDTGSHKAVRTTTLPVSLMIRFIFNCPKFPSPTREATIYVTHPPIGLSTSLFFFLILSLSFLLTFQQAHLILHAVDFTLCQSWIQHLRFDWGDISNYKKKRKNVRDGLIFSIVILDKWEQQSFQGTIVFCVTSL